MTLKSKIHPYILGNVLCLGTETESSLMAPFPGFWRHSNKPKSESPKNISEASFLKLTHSVLDLLGRCLLLRLPLEFVLNLDGQSHFNHLVPTLFGHSEHNFSWNQDKLITKGAAKHRGSNLASRPAAPGLIRNVPQIFSEEQLSTLLRLINLALVRGKCTVT